MSLAAVVLGGSVGSLLGALFWYYVGKRIGAERLKAWSRRYGRWLTLQPQDIDKVNTWFVRHSAKALFIGRLIPAIRTLISVPAGIFEISLPRFLFYSSLGTLLWTAFLGGAGYALESQYARIADYLNPVSNIVVGLIVVGYLYRVVTWKAE